MLSFSSLSFLSSFNSSICEKTGSEEGERKGFKDTEGVPLGEARRGSPICVQDRERGHPAERTCAREKAVSSHHAGDEGRGGVCENCGRRKR